MSLTNISVTKILAVLTLLAIVFDVLLHHRRVRPRRLVTPETILAVALLIVLMVSTFLHPTQRSAAEVVRQMVLLLFVLVVVYFVDRPQRLRQVAMTLVIAGTAIAMYSVVQRVTLPVSVSEAWVAQAGAVLDVGEANVGDMLRTTGTFSHPAWLGLFLSMCLPFTLGLSWKADKRRWRLVGGIAVCVQLLGILSTYSRMSYVGAGLAIAMFMCRRRFGVALLMLAVTAGISVFPALPKDFRARVYSIIEYRESSSSLSRIGQQIAGWHMFLDYPYLGIGPGNFEDKVVDYAKQVPVPLEVQPIGAHNMYMEIASELGLIGLALTLGLLVLTKRELSRLRCWARDSRNRRQEMLWECAGIALVVFVVSALFVHAQYRKEWWLLVGLAAAGRQFMTARRMDVLREESTS